MLRLWYSVQTKQSLFANFCNSSVRVLCCSVLVVKVAYTSTYVRTSAKVNRQNSSSMAYVLHEDVIIN